MRPRSAIWRTSSHLLRHRIPTSSLGPIFSIQKAAAMASSHAHIVADGPWTSATAETPDALRVEQVDAATWDAALEAFDDVNYEQTAAYAERRWGNEHVICLLVRERGALVGAACHGLIRAPLLGRVG